MVPIVGRRRRQNRVCRNKKRCDSSLTAAKSVGARAKEQESDGHVDRHIVAIAHLTLLQPFSKHAELAESLNVASSGHYQTKSEGQDAQTGLNCSLIDLVLGLRGSICENRPS